MVNWLVSSIQIFIYLFICWSRISNGFLQCFNLGWDFARLAWWVTGSKNVVLYDSQCKSWKFNPSRISVSHAIDPFLKICSSRTLVVHLLAYEVNENHSCYFLRTFTWIFNLVLVLKLCFYFTLNLLHLILMLQQF